MVSSRPRITATSGLIGDACRSLRSSRSTSLLAAGDRRPSASLRAYSAVSSSGVSPASSISSRITRSFSCRKSWRWALSMRCCTLLTISCSMPSTAFSSARASIRARRRSCVDSISRSACLSAVSICRCAATTSAISSGSSVWLTTYCSSSASCGLSCTYPANSTATRRASERQRTSARSGGARGVELTRKNGSVLSKRSMRTRSWPSTSAFTLPSGSLKSCSTLTRVPTGMMSSAPGSSTDASRCELRMSGVFWLKAVSMAWMDFSRPTKRGATILGKTTSSRVGSSCRAAAGAPGRTAPSAAAASPSGRLGVTLRRRLLRLDDQRGVDASLDALPRDHAFAHVAPRGQVEHHAHQRLLDDRAQAARPRTAAERLGGDGPEGLVGEHQLDSVQREELPVLLGERVLGLGEDAPQVGLVEVVHGRDHRQTADELGDQPEVEQVFGQGVREDRARVLVRLARDVGHEAHALAAHAALDDLLEAGEGAATDEEDVGGVDGEKLLVGVLAPALRRHARHGALEDLEQGLLHALARHVAGDRRVVGLARDLVDLVDVDDAGLGALEVEVGGLDELEQDVLDVLADVPGLGEGGGVGDGERYVEDARKGLRQQRLAAAGGAEQQDVALLQLDVGLAGGDRLHALVVVVHGHGERALGLLLADHVVVEDRVDVARLGQALEIQSDGRGELLVDDLVTEVDALVADVHAGAGDELLDLALRLAAETAEQLIVTVGRSCHLSLLLEDSPRPR